MLAMAGRRWARTAPPAALAYACTRPRRATAPPSPCGRCRRPEERLRQQQPGTGPDQVTWQRRKPPLNRDPFAAQVEPFVEVLLDQPRGPGHLPGGHRVPYRVIGHFVVVIPGRRVPVQQRRPAGLLLLQAGAEQVGEQMMVAPPTAHLVQRHHEQPRPFDLLQQRLTARPRPVTASQRLPRQPLQHRGLQQEGAHLVAPCCSSTSSARKSRMKLVAAGERVYEPSGIGLPAQ